MKIELIEINSIYDFISLFCLLINIYFIFSFDIILIIGLILCICIQFMIKYITTDLYPPIFKRPDGAMNCNLFNTGGLVDTQSGFPSGHVTIMSFFMEMLLLKYNTHDLINKFYFNIPTILVGYARIKKGCHNLIQVIAGYLLGYSIANILHRYEKDVNEYMKNTFPSYLSI